MKGKNIFGKHWVHAVIWQLVLVSIVTAALVDRVVSIGAGSVVA
jgi:hypothetical protein